MLPYYYIFIFVLAVLLVPFSNKINNTIFKYSWISIVLILSVALRSYINYDVISSDIEAYIDIFSTIFQEEYRVFYLREFIFWYSGGLLYEITNNGKIVFLIFDLILFTILFRVFTDIRKTSFSDLNENSTKLLLLSFLLFFPFIIGMHGSYRQLFASMVFLYSINKTVDREFFKAAVYFLSAVLIHNSTIIFLPLILFMTNIKINKIISILLIAFMPFSLNFLLNSDLDGRNFAISTGFIGETIAYWYLAIFGCITLLVIIFNKYLCLFQHKSIVQYITILLLIYVANVFVIPSEPAERLAFYICILMYPMLGYFSERVILHTNVVRFMFLGLTLSPLIYYSNIII